MAGPRRGHLKWSILLAALGASGCSQARTGLTAGGERGPRRGEGHAEVQAIAVLLPPLIDGRLDEGIWQHTRGYSDFVVIGQRPRAAKRRTEFRVAYDAANLYIALLCPTDTSIGPPRVRHWQDDDEELDEDESCRVLLWPTPSPPGVYFEITVNPQGVVCDARRHWGYPVRSAIWEGPIQSAATIARGAWQVELRIPLKRLGVPEQPWHVNVIRHDALAGERSSLAPVDVAGGQAQTSGAASDLVSAAQGADAQPAAPVPPRAILRWPAPARPFLIGPLPLRQVALGDMERAIDRWGTADAVVTASSDHVRAGRRSLQVTYPAGGGRVGWSPRQGDLSGWEALRFDAFVDGHQPMAMGVALRDAVGRTTTGWFLARPGANDIALPLDLLSAGLMVRGLKSVELCSRGAGRVWLDNLRLEEDTLSFHEWTHSPARPSRCSLAVKLAPAVLERTAVKAIAVDVTVPLYHTRRVRRLQHRPTTLGSPMVFAPREFNGHDARDPIRVTLFVRGPEQDRFAFRELRLTGPQASVAFGPEDLPGPAPSSGPTSDPTR